MAAPDLTGRSISSTYKDLLQVSNLNAGVDTGLKDVQDGEGTVSALQVSTAGIKSSGTLDVTGNTALAGELSLGGVSITSTAAELNILDGVTSTAAELNILDGVTSTAAELNILDGATATTAELNYVDGVTSAIQTQMDLKAPLASPALTGTPSAPTAAAGTNTTQVATTAFVLGEVTTHDADDLEGTTLASNVVSSSLTSFGASPALGTPASGVATNLTGTAAGLTAGNVTTNANLTGDVTSVGNATTIATDAVDIAMLSATGTASSSTFLRGDNAWETVSATVTIDNTSIGSGTAGSVLFVNSSNQLSQDNDKFFFDESSGNVGIGTAAPGVGALGSGYQYLTIEGSTSARLELSSSASDAADITAGALEFVFPANDATYRRIAQITGVTKGSTSVKRGGQLAFSTSSDGSTAMSERMIITEAGLVGIGATAPARHLSISSSDATVGMALYDSTSGTSTTDGFQLQIDSGNGYVWMYENRDLVLGTNNATRMTIDSAGLVGIGGVTPSANLHVQGVTSGVGIRVEDTGTTDGIYFYENGTQRGVIGYGDSGQIVTGASADSMTVRAENALHFASGADNLRMTIDSAGLVGIGEPSPDSPLHISHATAPTVILERTDSSAGKWQFNVSNTTVGDFAISDLATGSPVHRLMIDASGNVGIRTTDLSASGANARLGVDSGFINVDDTYGLCWGGGTGRPNISGSKSAGTVTIDNVSVGVGIGGTPTAAKLEVFGDLSVIENTVAGNTVYGRFGPTTIDGNTRAGGIQLNATSGTDRTWGISADGAKKLHFEYLGARATTLGSGTVAMTIDSTGVVGIGTSAPDGPLHIATQTTNVGQLLQGSYDSNANPILTLRKSDGTIASPTAITSGHIEGMIRFDGYDGNSWHTSADIYAITSGTVADGRIASDLVFRTAPDSVAGVSEAMRINSNGDISAEGSVSLKERASAAADTAAYGQIWVKTGTPNTLYFTDDAGTDVQLGAGGGGSGDVSKVGTPVDNQVGVWTGDGTIEGTSSLTFDGTYLVVNGQIQQADETLPTGDTVDIDFSLSNLQTFALDGTESQTALTGSNYAAGRTVRLMIDMSNDSHSTGITPPSNWTNFGDDPTSVVSSGLVLCELTSWTGADTGVTAYWKESS